MPSIMQQSARMPSMTIDLSPAGVVRQYLGVFVTRDLDVLAALVADDVVAHGAGRTVRGRDVVAGAVLTPGLTCTRLDVEELVELGDRVVVAFTMTYRQDRTGRTATMPGMKMYRLEEGQIVEFWGETDLHGLLRGLGLVPDELPSLA
jgi:ketosteroid isomerase-like protein